AEGLQLPVAIVDDSDGGREAELEGALADDERVLRVLDAAADHGVDVDVELRVFGEQLELLVEHLQTLLRDLVGQDVVDGDLEVIEAGAIEALDALGGQQVPVGDHARDHSAAADVRDDGVEIRVKQRLAAGDRDDRSAETGEAIEALVHGLERNGFRRVIEFVTVGARKITAAHRDNMRKDREIGRDKTADDHPDFARAAAERSPTPPETFRQIGHTLGKSFY